jgi:hypothetical protein
VALALWLDAEVLRDLSKLVEVEVLPHEGDAALPDRHHHHVEEGLLVERFRATLVAEVVSDLQIQLPELVHAEPVRLDILSWDVDVLEILWLSLVAELCRVNLGVQLQVGHLDLVLFDLDLLGVNHFLQRAQYLHVDLVFEGNCVDNPVIKHVVHLSRLLIRLVQDD